jgi:hypothetical protein
MLRLPQVTRTAILFLGVVWVLQFQRIVQHGVFETAALDIRKQNMHLVDTSSLKSDEVAAASTNASNSSVTKAVVKMKRKDTTAIVWVTRYLDECGAARLRHFVETAGAVDSLGRKRDAWILHGHHTLLSNDTRLALSKRLIGNITGLKSQQQEESQESLFPFDSLISGTAKSSFLRLMVNNGYSNAWHVEDDNFYTGPWSEVFNSDLISDDADVVAAYRKRPTEKPCWCSVRGRKEPCNQIKRETTLWMVLRASLPFATALLEDLVNGTIYGHHEPIVASFCHLRGFHKEQLPQEMLLPGKFVPGHWGKWNNARNQRLARMNPEPSYLYHPVKCAAHTKKKDLHYLLDHLVNTTRANKNNTHIQVRSPTNIPQQSKNTTTVAIIDESNAERVNPPLGRL